MIKDEATPMPNGDIPKNPFDPETANLPELAGFVLSLDVEVRRQGGEQSRQGKLIDKIATSLGISVEKSEPPPAFRKQLDSQREEILALQKTDAETTGNLKAVSAEVAETKVILRVGLIEGIPKLVKVGGALVAVLGVLAALAQQIWSVVHGH